MSDIDYIEQAKRSSNIGHRNVERAILETPTGEVRNLLTEANIHLMMAKQALEKAQVMNK